MIYELSQCNEKDTFTTSKESLLRKCKLFLRYCAMPFGHPQRSAGTMANPYNYPHEEPPPLKSYEMLDPAISVLMYGLRLNTLGISKCFFIFSPFF
jgi:hypothetical protein